MSVSFPDHFGLSVERSGESLVVHLEGELDIACEECFATALWPLVERGASIVIDLRALTFIDSTGIRMLIATHDRARRVGAEVAVVPGDAHVRRTIELTGLDQIVPMVEGEIATAPAASAA